MAAIPHTVPLPSRKSDKAPRFDVKNPLSLWDYFVDYEVLAEAARLDEATKIKQSIIYLDRQEADFWESLDEYVAATDWEAFKTAVLSYYPGSVPKDRWTLDDLSKLCETQQHKRIITRGDYAEFQRQFLQVSKSLVVNGSLSEIEMCKLFWNALDTVFQVKIERKIELTKPEYTRKMILTLAEIRKAAGLILDGTLAETSTMDVMVKESSPTPAQEVVKSEPFDMDRFTQQIGAMMSQTVETAITTAINRMTNAYAPPIQAISTRNTGPSSYIPPRANGAPPVCYMCGQTGHYLSTCTMLQQYLSEGKLRRDAQGNYCLSSGDRIPNYPRNVPWIQKIEEYYKRFPLLAPVPPSAETAPRASANLVEIREVQDSGDPKNELDSYIAALQRINTHPDDDEEDLEEVMQVLEARVTRKKKADMASAQGPQEPVMVPVVDTLPKPIAKPAPAPAPFTSKAQDQQYRFQAPCEVLVQPTDIFNRILGQTLTMNVEELLALCPDIRKYFKEATTTRRVAVEGPRKENPTKVVTVNSVAALSGEGDPQDGLDAIVSMPLRIIDVTVNDAHNVAGILDSGCQIIVMRKDVWTSLRLPLRTDRTLDMESANGTTNKTLGLLPRVKFSIGDVHLYCPVQVVESAPFELLLGRPFTTCGQAVVRDLFDGNMEVTLTDPRSGAVVTCQTRPRGIGLKAKPDHASANFQ